MLDGDAVAHEAEMLHDVFRTAADSVDGTDDEDKVQKRLLRAKVELKMADRYDYFVVNDTVDNAVFQLKSILCAEHCKSVDRIEKLLVE